jgi:hypothetical protein
VVSGSDEFSIAGGNAGVCEFSARIAQMESSRFVSGRAQTQALLRAPSDMADAGGSMPSRRTNSRSCSTMAVRPLDKRLAQVRFLTGAPTTRRTTMPETAACLQCATGLEPVKMKRQWVHHFRGDGRIAVSADRNLKPGRLAAAIIHHDGSGALNLTGDGAAF